MASTAPVDIDEQDRAYHEKGRAALTEHAKKVHEEVTETVRDLADLRDVLEQAQELATKINRKLEGWAIPGKFNHEEFWEKRRLWAVGDLGIPEVLYSKVAPAAPEAYRQTIAGIDLLIAGLRRHDEDAQTDLDQIDVLFPPIPQGGTDDD